MAGRASIELRAREAGLDLSGRPDIVVDVLARVKDLEQRGWTFDSTATGDAVSEATVKLHADGARHLATGDGIGPVNALDHALREALAKAYPEIEKLELIDYKVRILDASHGMNAVTRVLIETSDGETWWDTIGVAGSILAASWRALTDGLAYGLIRQGVTRRA